MALLTAVATVAVATVRSSSSDAPTRSVPSAGDGTRGATTGILYNRSPGAGVPGTDGFTPGITGTAG